MLEYIFVNPRIVSMGKHHSHFTQMISALRRTAKGNRFKCFSEEGSETCNKLIRKYREHLARITSFEDNISDIFIRLASESDQGLLEFRSKSRCERCREEGHTRRKIDYYNSKGIKLSLERTRPNI